MLKDVYVNGYSLPVDNISVLKFKESLFDMKIEGVITFIDPGFKDDIMNKSRNIITIHCHDKIKDEDLAFQFVIYSNPNTEKDAGNQTMNTTLLFCNNGYDAIIGQNAISKYYNQIPISEILKEKCEEIGLQIGEFTDTVLLIDYSYDGLLKNNINWFKKFSEDGSGNAGFVFYYDIFKNVYNYINIINIIKSEYIEVNENPIVHNSTNPDYIGLASKLVIEDDLDTNEMIDYGVVNRLVGGFDFDTGKEIINKEDITESLSDIKLMIPLDKRYIEPIYTHKEVLSGYSEDMISAYKNAIYTYNAMNISRVRVYLANGDYNRRLGQMIPLAIEKNTVDGKMYDASYTGYYVASEIEHIWNGKDYNQVILLSRMGVAKSIDDFVKI